MASTASMPPYMLPGVPVVQPPHLDGDPSLATEILPGPPPIATVQQAAVKRDTKKPVSYLPPLDPNSTYSALLAITPASSIPQIDGPRPKRMRAERGATSGRAQRASARNQHVQNGIVSAPNPSASNEGGSISAVQTVSIDVDASTIAEDVSNMPPSASSQTSSDKPAVSSNGRGRPRRDKGKGKEVESSVKVKEEPKTVLLHTPEPPLPMILNNEDHCSACRSTGALIYCDGCPRAFHFWCLDPPEENVEDGNSKWFCPACITKKYPPRKPPPSILSPLVQQLTCGIPGEFQLPDDIRNFFKDVTSAPNGAYVDNSETKQPRLNRHGQLDERDPHRLRDRNGAPVLCFRCGTSALPESVAAAAPATKRARRSSSAAISETWKPIVSCDYCSLHWHLDCLDPPLTMMPTFNKKWMCPNHAEQVIPLKRRIPKHNAPPIEITGPDQFNNGNIEVIHPETVSTSQPKVAVDEVLINGRRYRVPERVIVLDFWSRVGRGHSSQHRTVEEESGMSSPLTSLSSLEDDMDEWPPHHGREAAHSAEDLQVAKMLCAFRGTNSFRFPRSPSKASAMVNGLGRHPSKSLVDTGVQTDGEIQLMPHPPRPTSRTEKLNVSARRIAAPAVNGMTRAFTNESISMHPGPSISPVKRRRKSTASIQPEPSTRELRSRTKKEDASSTSISGKGSSVMRSEATPRRPGLGKTMSASDYLVHAGVVSPRDMRPPDIIPAPRIKLEDNDSNAILHSATISSSTPLPKPKRVRTRRAPQKDTDGPMDVKQKRGRKRKQREDEADPVSHPDKASAPQTSRATEGEKARKERALDKGNTAKQPVESGQVEKPKATRTPKRAAQPISTSSTSAPPSSASRGPMTATTGSVTSTPTLKIRLPRLSNVNLSLGSSPQRQGLNVDTPTCL